MKIAVIDDNQTNVMVLERLLRQHFALDSVSFNDPWLGLEWCLTHRPDLILLDYMMPGLDGLGFVTAFREDNASPDTQIIMITGNTDLQVRYEALDAGANDFLTKPLDAAEFRARVKNMLALSKSHHALRDRAAWLAVEVERATANIRSRELETIFLLSKAAEYRDPETGAHILRMATFSAMIARELGLGEPFANLIYEASPMHDIGKVGTPDRILLKPGKLDPDEMTIMQQHAMNGYEILKDSHSPVLQMAANIALCHHEKFDGSGYPRGLKGSEIPIEGRIVAVADVFDALTSTRPYKRAWPVDDARQFLTDQSGKHFDPDIVEAFLRQFDAVLAFRHQHMDDDTPS
ncbi:response regulator [Burkholderiaceae bacterium DAT-1]|nr:response regulator [Burkholderiaceae bacterium DAT-1]